MENVKTDDSERWRRPTIGIVGGGQLALMLLEASLRLDLDIRVLASPGRSGYSGQPRCSARRSARSAGASPIPGGSPSMPRCIGRRHGRAGSSDTSRFAMRILAVGTPPLGVALHSHAAELREAVTQKDHQIDAALR